MMLSLCLCLVLASGDSGDLVTFQHPNGEKAREGRVVNGRREGPWTAWYSNGKLAYEGSFKDYEHVGHWIYYRPEGGKQMEGDWVAGRRHGVWTTYGAGEKKVSEGAYEHGALTGHWTYWRPS